MIQAFISRESSNYSINSLCDALDVNRSSYYSFNDSLNNKKERLAYNALVSERILSIFEDSNHIYGSPKITQILRKEGFKISQKTVLKHMQVLGIKSCVYTSFVKRNSYLTEQEKSLIENLIKDFPITSINQIGVCDITYIKTVRDGTVYLASIMDLYSRKIIAWEVCHNMKQELVMHVFQKAYSNRKPKNIVIVHSDKGSQYRSRLYRQLLVKNHCVFSYTSLHHSCDENANQESFHSLIKKEHLYQKVLFTIDDVRRECFIYIEGFYNSKRIHGALNYISPIEFENLLFS